MFFLMLFFLIMSTMVAPSVIKVNLPKTNAGKAVSKQNLVLAIDSNLNYYLNNKQMQFNELEPALLAFSNPDTSLQPNIVLKPDRNISVQNLVDVMTIANKLKMKMSLATTNK
jgi:biopolymer transport protein ExbD